MNTTPYSEQLADVMRAEIAGVDLQEGPNGVHVIALDSEGEAYELGFVSFELVYQDRQAALNMIERIKFFDRNKAV